VRAGTIPLGNGEFCFNADGTGLQTFGGNTMSHWGWHSFPLPAGVTADQIPATGTFETGRVEGQDNPPAGTDAIETWMQQNPHIMEPGPAAIMRRHRNGADHGRNFGPGADAEFMVGVQTSSYQVSGQTVTVTTCVHPALDAVVVRIQSPLVASGALQVALDFPYPALANNAWVGNFSQTSGNTTSMTLNGGSRADFARALDTTNYDVSLAWSAGGQIAAVGSARRTGFCLSAPGTNSLEFICAFSPRRFPPFQRLNSPWWTRPITGSISGAPAVRLISLPARIRAGLNWNGASCFRNTKMAAQDAGSWPESETD
jgi:hypothetical protein